MDTLDIAVRLGAATLVGVLLGLNRDLHGKSTGVRTLGLVCLGSALAVLSIHAATGSEESRVIQGIVTGVGFLGAGVIIRSEKGYRGPSNRTTHARTCRKHGGGPSPMRTCLCFGLLICGNRDFLIDWGADSDLISKRGERKTAKNQALT